MWECKTTDTRHCSTDRGASNDESQPELCNDLDDDCDTDIDEGTNEALCADWANAREVCNHDMGRCVIDRCDDNYFDLNGDAPDGCECQGDDNESNGGDRCANAVRLGGLIDDSRQRLTVTGNLVEAPGVVAGSSGIAHFPDPGGRAGTNGNCTCCYLSRPGSTRSLPTDRAPL